MLSKSKILMAKDGVLLTWSNREKRFRSYSKEVSANMVIFIRHAENNRILSKFARFVHPGGCSIIRIYGKSETYFGDNGAGRQF